MSAAALKKIPQELLDRAANDIRVRNDAIDYAVDTVVKAGRCDVAFAPAWAEKLRFTYTRMPEYKYPELVAANGGVLPIDSSVDPTALEWEYYMIDSGGYHDWIDEDGDVLHSTYIRGSRHTGRHAEEGGGYHWTIFDLERSVKLGLQLQATYQKADRKASDEKVEWVWMCGESSKGIFGLLTHPNIPHVIPAAGASTSRLWSQKTDAEIMTDVTAFLDAVPQNSIEAHHIAKVLMPFSLIRELQGRFIASTADGMVSLWDRLLKRYSGDPSGQGKVEFIGHNFCDASRRINPKTGTDTSGLSGDVLVALPPDDVENLAFIRSRPYTALPPQQERFKFLVATHSKIGGVKVVYPLSVAILEFGTT